MVVSEEFLCDQGSDSDNEQNECERDQDVELSIRERIGTQEKSPTVVRVKHRQLLSLK